MRVPSTVGLGLGLAGLLTAAVPAAATPQQPAGRDAVPQRQHLAWGPCSAAQTELNEAGAQCAKVTVPLD